MKTYSPVLVLTGRASGLTEPRRIGCEHNGATKGHRADQGGLRGHSVGDAFPWRVVGYGDGSWAVEDCRGNTFARCRDLPHDPAYDPCKRAHALARAFKVLHPLGYVEDTPGGCPANISGPLDEIAARLEGHLLVVNYANGGGDRLRVVDGGKGMLKVLNHSTGKLSLVSLPWLAHNQNLSVSLDTDACTDSQAANTTDRHVKLAP